ncbi:MAG: NUDIX domain-containing protein [Pseudomonadota bacterium]
MNSMLMSFGRHARQPYKPQMRLKGASAPGKTPQAGAQSQNERLDVVDVDDKVIDQAKRGEIHRLRLRHRAVHMLVFNRQGRLFVQQRALAKDSFPGYWDTSAAGHLDAGETYDQAARRELSEELGLQASLEKVGRLEASAATGFEFVNVYRAVTDQTPVPAKDEIMATRWFEITALGDEMDRGLMPFTPSFRVIFARFVA